MKLNPSIKMLYTYKCIKYYCLVCVFVRFPEYFWQKYISMSLHYRTSADLYVFISLDYIMSLIARIMGPTWGSSGADRTQVGHMLAPWTLLSGYIWSKDVLSYLYPFKVVLSTRPEIISHFIYCIAQVMLLTLVQDWCYTCCAPATVGSAQISILLNLSDAFTQDE